VFEDQNTLFFVPKTATHVEKLQLVQKGLPKIKKIVIIKSGNLNLIFKNRGR